MSPGDERGEICSAQPEEAGGFDHTRRRRVLPAVEERDLTQHVPGARARELDRPLAGQPQRQRDASPDDQDHPDGLLTLVPEHFADPQLPPAQEAGQFS